MERKPQDLLEFLRRTTGAEGRPAASEPDFRPLPVEPAELVVRRSQIIIATVAAALLVVLAFLLGLSFGGDSPEGGNEVTGVSPVWAIRAITYPDTEQGAINAKITMGELESVLQEQVSIQRIPSKNQLTVVVGAWLRDPGNDPRFRALLEKIRNQPDVTGKKPFSDAGQWQIPR